MKQSNPRPSRKTPSVKLFTGALYPYFNRMHEAFDPDEPSLYTRPWFAWANTLLASLLVKLKKERFFD